MYGREKAAYEYGVMGNRTAVTKTAEDRTVAEWEKYEYNESQYLRARYYNVVNANFLTEDSYLGNIPVETIADIAFIVWDIVATALPYIPGSYVVKGIDKIKDVLTFTKKVDNAQDISGTVKLVDDVPELVDKALDTAEAGSKGSNIESKGAKECLEEAEEEAIENSAKKATCDASSRVEVILRPWILIRSVQIILTIICLIVQENSKITH